MAWLHASPIMMPTITSPAPYGSPSWTRSKLAASMTPHAMAFAKALQRVDSVPTKKNGTAPRQLAAAMMMVSNKTAPADTSFPSGGPLLCNSCCASCGSTACCSCCRLLLWVLAAPMRAPVTSCATLCSYVQLPGDRTLPPWSAWKETCKQVCRHQERMRLHSGAESYKVCKHKELAFERHDPADLCWINP